MTAPLDDERPGRRAILRRDHVAGGIFMVAGVVLFAMSGDLPFGTLASPGAGMMPKLVLGLMMIFALTLIVQAGESPPLAEIEWSNLTHAATVVVMAAAATALYTVIGFVLSISALLFVLLYFIERRNIWRAAAVSIGVTFGAYYVFNTLLKSPLPPMPFWY